MVVEQAGAPEQCKIVDASITRVFQVLGKRWNGPIISVLVDGPAHFADLHRAVPGISQRVLSDRLAELAATGLLVREVDEGPPLRTSYRLADKGAALASPLRELGAWAREHLMDEPAC